MIHSDVKSAPKSPAPIRDLVDFYNQWPALRAWAVRAAQQDSLSREEREVITWLTALADRVGDRDVI